MVADGCNWGEAPRTAAVTTRNTIMEFIEERQHNIFTVEDAQILLLRALCLAQKNVIQNNQSMVKIQKENQLFLL